MAIVFHCHDEETQGVHYDTDDVKDDGPITPKFLSSLKDKKEFVKM